MRRFAVVIALVLAVAGCRSYVKATGDFKVDIAGEERAIDVHAGLATIRVLNRGACPVAVRHGEEIYLLNTSDDKEIVLRGQHVIHLERRGIGEGLVEVHFVAEGRYNTVNLR
ncbi:MAG: hypothetical protein AAB074_01755 [Planctomycetota bacterium]